MFTSSISSSQTENALLMVCCTTNGNYEQQDAVEPKVQTNLSKICEITCGLGMSFLVIFFQVLVLYALVTSNVNGVSIACGSLLWNFMFSRFVLVFVELIILGVTSAVLHNEACNDPIYYNMKQVAFLVISHAIYIVFEGISIQQSMDSTQCVAALSNVSFTNTPLLGILCYIYLTLDILAVLLSTCACVLMIVIVGQPQQH